MNTCLMSPITYIILWAENYGFHMIFFYTNWIKAVLVWSMVWFWIYKKSSKIMLEK